MSEKNSPLTNLQLTRILNSETCKKLIELRIKGHNLTEACQMLGVSYSAGRRYVQQYLKANPHGAATEFREQELEHLEEIQEMLMAKARKRYVKVNAGQVVMVPLKTPEGNTVIERDPNTGQLVPVMVEMEDDGPQNDAIGLLLKLAQRKATLLGLDIPVPKTPVDPEDPNKPQTSAERDAALIKATVAALGIKRMVRDADQVEDAVEVVPRVVELDPIAREVRS